MTVKNKLKSLRNSFQVGTPDLTKLKASVQLQMQIEVSNKDQIQDQITGMDAVSTACAAQLSG